MISWNNLKLNQKKEVIIIQIDIKNIEIRRFRIIMYFLFGTLLLSACGKDDGESPTPINLSDDFASCNSQLSACTNGNGQYCLFGFKWGNDSLFEVSNINSGPKSSGGIVNYSFQEENGFINTHRQINLPSKSYNKLLPCAKNQIRKALMAWANIANIEFVESSNNSKSQIRFYVADILQSGIGYPNYPDDLCGRLSGSVIIQSELIIRDCDSFYIFALHEIGHVLGLGHVNSNNVMNPNFSSFNFQELQVGDTLGIVQIYGENLSIR
ncbi:matrixin family metalloprotease [Maribacter sp. 4G9]|uniref:matrixin family metalloprotease n=1 Tax=Maribacter sp. 4G9 TaxID=1889777 RepID=UPI000C161058|nr:matrixin family metalloprotease [Maribacter sp. 4G9]PIB37972.1 hypothetical protein BFP75_18815 [Maribacter sp. 4G9]